MNAACPVIDPTAGGAQTLVASVDCFVKSSVQDGYAALLGQGSVFSQALTIALTLYVAIIGYRLIFGRSSLNLGEFAPKALLIGGVLALSSNWAAYQVLVFDLLTDGPQEVAMMMGPQGGSTASLTARVDAVSGKIADVAADWAAASAPRAEQQIAPALLPKPVLGESPGPNLLLFSALLLVLCSAGVLAVAKILLGLLLAIGPIFVGLGLFGVTRGLTFGWARVCVLLALVPLLSLMTSAGALAMIEPMVVTMAVQATGDDYSLRAAVALFVAVLVMAAVSFQLFRIAAAITAGWSASLTRRTMVSTTQGGEVSVAAIAPSQSATVNPRVDVLINALERSAMSVPVASNLLRRDIATAPVPRQGQRSNDHGTVSRQRIGLTHVAQNRAPLRPVRSAA
jgi:type IV secretion system protein VirB6